MILRTICKNKYQENEVVHACINEDMSGGFVLTTKAICLFAEPCFYQSDDDDKPNYIIPYSEIKSVEASRLKITLKDGNYIMSNGIGYWQQGCWTFNNELSTYLNALIE